MDQGGDGCAGRRVEHRNLRRVVVVKSGDADADNRGGGRALVRSEKRMHLLNGLELANRGIAQRTLGDVYYTGKRRRRRYRRLNVYFTDPRRLRGDLRTTNRQDSTDAPAMAGSSISRIKKLIFSPPRKCPIALFGPISYGTVLERLLVAFDFEPSVSLSLSSR